MLYAGYHLYRGDDGTWRYSAPGDTFVRVRGDDRLLEIVQRVEVTGSNAGLNDDDALAVARVRDALVGQGVVVNGEASPAPDRAWRVHLAGDGPVAEQLIPLVGGVQLTRGTVDEQAVKCADVLVCCAQWLPDRDWQLVDDWCRDHCTPWHGCYAEGTQVVIGPLSIPGRTANYRDTRGRRLAAAGRPDELLAHWSYLDSEMAKPSPPWTAGAAAVAAGLIALDLAALRVGAPAPSEGFQLVFDPGTAAISRHPVLPLPQLAGVVRRTDRA